MNNERIQLQRLARDLATDARARAVPATTFDDAVEKLCYELAAVDNNHRDSAARESLDETLELDDARHGEADRQAAEINAHGFERQFEYLLEQNWLILGGEHAGEPDLDRGAANLREQIEALAPKPGLSPRISRRSS
jgi:hypothetical protein